MSNLSYMISTVNWDGELIRRVADDEIERSLDLLQSCGINEVMLTGYMDIEKAEFDMFDETARIGDKLRSRGMKAAQHHGLANTFATPEKSQEKVVRELINCVKYTKNLNADVLVIHPGRIDEYHSSMTKYHEIFLEQIKVHSFDRIIEICARNLRLAGEEASKLGIKIALENDVGGDPAGTIENLPALVEKIDSPVVGYCFDSGHAHYCGAPVTTWINKMGSKLFTTHLHDNRGTTDEHLPPGFGTIPWIDVIQSLKKIGYSSSYNFESGGWTNMDLKDGYECAIRFWHTLEHLAENKHVIKEVVRK